MVQNDTKAGYSIHPERNATHQLTSNKGTVRMSDHINGSVKSAMRLKTM